MLHDHATHTISPPAFVDTLGGQLERRRLEHRARRLRLAITALRERHAAAATVGRVPHALQQAIRDFSSELSAIEDRLEAHRRLRGARR